MRTRGRARRYRPAHTRRPRAGHRYRSHRCDRRSCWAPLARTAGRRARSLRRRGHLAGQRTRRHRNHRRQGAAGTSWREYAARARERAPRGPDRHGCHLTLHLLVLTVAANAVPEPCAGPRHRVTCERPLRTGPSVRVAGSLEASSKRSWRSPQPCRGRRPCALSRLEPALGTLRAPPLPRNHRRDRRSGRRDRRPGGAVTGPGGAVTSSAGVASRAASAEDVSRIAATVATISVNWRSSLPAS